MSTDLPVSRGSGVDSELERLMRAHPERTRQLLHEFHNIRNPRKQQQQQQQQLAGSKKGGMGRTHYQETFVAKDARMRSSKRPDRGQPMRTQAVPGAYQTSQRQEFVPKDLAEARNAPAAVRSSGEDADGADWQWRHGERKAQDSVYTSEFKERQLEERTSPKGAPKQKSRVLVPGGKFQTETTSGEAYKNWRTGGGYGLRYGELPAFMGSVLNPGRGMETQTVNMAAYVAPKGAPAAAAVPAVGNIQLDGEQDFHTVNRETYKPLPLQAPVRHRSDSERVQRLERKVPMYSETQTGADYKGVDTTKFRRPQAFEPPANRLDLRYDRQGYYSTEQRQEFQGFDVREHPMPASCKKDPSSYTAPEGRMEAESTTRKDFQPKEIKDAYRERVKPPVASTRFAGEMATTTTSKEAFKAMQVDASPRVRFGDFHMAYHAVPKTKKLEGHSETQEAFVAQPLQFTASFKPDPKAKGGAAPDGEQNFDTVHRTTYQQPRFHLTRQQAEAVRTELRRLESIRRQQQQQQQQQPLPGIAKA